MKYTIISDSCCNIFAKDLNSSQIDFHVVPLTLILGNEEFIDDDKLDTRKFVEKMNGQKIAARSACPSPEAFAEIMRKGDNIIVVTISAKLSATNASAVTAASIIKKEFPNKNICVIDTLTACTGQDRVLFKLKEVIESGKHSFDDVAEKFTQICHSTRVRFLLQDLGNLIKNGRMNKVVGTMLSAAKIKVICGENEEGEIKKFGLSLGTKKGLANLAEFPKAAGREADNLITVAHVHNEEDALFIKKMLETKFGFRNVKVLLMRGLSSLYAADKGIVIAY